MISWGCFETAAPKQDREKTYTVEFSLNTNAPGSLPGKSPQWSHLIKLIGLPLETEPLHKNVLYVSLVVFGKTIFLKG